MSTHDTIAVRVPALFAPLELSLDGTAGDPDDAFVELCRNNPDLRLERDAQGVITIMPPAGGESGHRNAVVLARVVRWAETDGSGVVFDSSTGFRLPNGAVRAPDVAWVRRERLAGLSADEKEGFLPLCPDFVVEIGSPSDRLTELQEKMEEYLANGARLGWLLDPGPRTAYVYRPDLPVEVLVAPRELDGGPELPGLVAPLARIWEPDF
jgi:Uma2 family endonuclease